MSAGNFQRTVHQIVRWRRRYMHLIQVSKILLSLDWIVPQASNIFPQYIRTLDVEKIGRIHHQLGWGRKKWSEEAFGQGGVIFVNEQLDDNIRVHYAG